MGQAQDLPHSPPHGCVPGLVPHTHAGAEHALPELGLPACAGHPLQEGLLLGGVVPLQVQLPILLHGVLKEAAELHPGLATTQDRVGARHTLQHQAARG